MKTTAKFLLIIISNLFLVYCTYEDIPDDEKSGEIELKSGQEFRYDFNISGDEEGASIITQAEHAEVSQLIRDELTNWSVVYRYKSVAGYTGIDSVEIETCTGGDGISCNQLDTLIFTFHVVK